MTQFEVAIVRQGWLEGCTPEYDLCSHGGIRLQIGGVLVTDGTEDYGISESALALLRTTVHDHTPGDNLTERLIFHGCGAMLMGGCYIGVDWAVRHEGDRVHVSDVVRFDDNSSEPPLAFPGASTIIARDVYVGAIVPFALHARQLFENPRKIYIGHELFPGEYIGFWKEFDDLLRKHGVASLSPIAV